MNVGYGAAGLPVPDGTPLGGYADRTERSAGTSDELQASCVAVQSGSTHLLLVVVDLVCVNGDVADAVAASVASRLRVAPAAVWTMATHTHSGPDVNCGVGSRRTPDEWRVRITDAAVRAAERAWAALRPGSLAVRHGEVRDVGSVRAVPDAPAVVPVDVVSVEGASGVEGVFVVLPVHPTVLPANNVLVSGDLAAAVRRRLAARLATRDTGPWVAVATGCAGDISTRATRRAQTPAENERLAGIAAEQLAAILAGPPARRIEGEPRVRAARRVLSLPVRADAPAPVAGPTTTGSDVEERIAHTLRQGLAVAEQRRARFPDGIVPLAVSAATLGELRIVGLGAEPYLRVRDLPSAPAIVLGYVNGYAGYLPDAGGFGRATYESLSSPFRPDAAAAAIRAAEALFDNPDVEENT